MYQYNSHWTSFIRLKEPEKYDISKIIDYVLFDTNEIIKMTKPLKVYPGQDLYQQKVEGSRDDEICVSYTTW